MRARTVQELREIATTREKPGRGSIHPPAGKERPDLLGQVAGILLGSAHGDHPEKELHGAELLREACADETVVEEWIPIGRERREGGGPPFSKAAPIRSIRPRDGAGT